MCLTVIFTPLEQSKHITNGHTLKLSEFSNYHALDGVLEVRQNTRLNLITVATRNMKSTKSLLKVNIYLGISHRAYEPMSLSKPVGVKVGRLVVRDFQFQIRSDVPNSHIRRLGS